MCNIVVMYVHISLLLCRFVGVVSVRTRGENQEFNAGKLHIRRRNLLSFYLVTHFNCLSLQM